MRYPLGVGALRFARSLPWRVLRRVNGALWRRGYRTIPAGRTTGRTRPSAPRPISIGVQLHPQHTSYADYRRAWLRVDALGVDTIWNWYPAVNAVAARVRARAFCVQVSYRDRRLGLGA